MARRALVLLVLLACCTIGGRSAAHLRVGSVDAGTVHLDGPSSRCGALAFSPPSAPPTG